MIPDPVPAASRDMVQQTIAEMRSAIALSQQFGTPVADHHLIRDWANQLERAVVGAAAVPPRLSDEDIDQLVEGIEEFIISGDERIEPIWRPYIQKLQAWKAAAVPPPQCSAVHLTHAMSETLARLRALASRVLAGVSKRNTAYDLGAAIIDQLEIIETAIAEECRAAAVPPPLDSQEGLFHPVHQVYFRAGLIACREYMARFVEAESPTIANSIRANWWPALGQDYGPPRRIAFGELTDGEYGTPAFRCKTAEEVSPTLEALPIALAFLEHGEQSEVVRARPGRLEEVHEEASGDADELRPPSRSCSRRRTSS